MSLDIAEEHDFDPSQTSHVHSLPSINLYNEDRCCTRFGLFKLIISNTHHQHVTYSTHAALCLGEYTLRRVHHGLHSTPCVDDIHVVWPTFHSSWEYILSDSAPHRCCVQ